MLKLRLADYSNDKITTYLVNGEYVRNNLYIDFTEGGNDCVYAEWMPAGEIWIDFDINPDEVLFVILHELYERNLMYDGMSYEEAHSKSNIIEGEARKDPTKLSQMIQFELGNIKTAKRVENKSMNGMIYKTYTPEIKEISPRVLEFTISTETMDRDNESIKASGWVLNDYVKNPVVLWAHKYDQPPIGKSLSIGVVNGKLVSQVQFADAETYGFADTVYRLCKGGYLSATSVGFVPYESNPGTGEIHKEYTKQSLLEFSILPVPSNPEALINARNAGLITVKDFTALTENKNKTIHSVSQKELADEMDYVVAIIKEVGISHENEEIAMSLIKETRKRLPESDISDDIKITKSMLVKQAKEAIQSITDAESNMDEHHNAHNVAYKAGKELITKAKEKLASIMGDESGENDEDDKKQMSELLSGIKNITK